MKRILPNGRAEFTRQFYAVFGTIVLVMLAAIAAEVFAVLQRIAS